MPVGVLTSCYTKVTPVVVLLDLREASPCNSSKFDMYMWYDIEKQKTRKIHKNGPGMFESIYIVGVHGLCICKCIVKVAYLAHVSLYVYIINLFLVP